MCDAFYRFEDGSEVSCEIVSPSYHAEHKGYVWYPTVNKNLAVGAFYSWRDTDEHNTLQTKELKYSQSEAVVLRQALGRFISSNYTSEAEQIRGAIAQQIIRKLEV